MLVCREMRRFFLLMLVLGLLVLVPFAIWGEGMETLWTVARLESFGQWAWLVGLGLLVGDLVVPMPSTVVMSALGYVYGIAIGGVVATFGAMGSAMLGYCLCRWVGEPVAVCLAGKEGLEAGKGLFGRYGAWVVALSRCLPVMAEVMACLAGMTGMPWRRFLVAALAGCVPMGFAFAALGQLGADSPVVALLVSALVPPILWVFARRLISRTEN